MKRLPPISGEWIDRTQPISFTFEGRRFQGFAGDTVSSALWASGQHVLGRSFKYHRPRGILSFANHDINALMQSGEKLNIRADVTPLAAEMSLEAVNTFGGVGSDRASILNFLSPFLPVGFYYKAFLNKKQFPFWERLIRNISGLGKADPATPHIRTPKRYDFCDVLVIGAGVSGLAAGLAAAEAGADVVIVDENAKAGGSGGYQRGGEQPPSSPSPFSLGEKGDRTGSEVPLPQGEGFRVRAAVSAFDITTELLNAIAQHPRIRLYTATQVAAYYADHWVPLVQKDRLIKMRSKAVIVASGAYEQPAVFHNNDLPGVMLASAAQRLIYRYAVQPMQRAVCLVANRDGYRAAWDLAANGVSVEAIVDLRENPPADLVQEAQLQNIPVFPGHCIYEAKPNPAGDGVASVVIGAIDSEGNLSGAKRSISCDGIVMSVGWSPAANLLYQAGTKMRFDEFLQQFVPAVLPAGVFACGRVNGVFGFEEKLQDGDRAGREAANYLGNSQPSPPRVGDFRADHPQSPPLVGDLGGKPNPNRSQSIESPSHPWPIAQRSRNGIAPYPKGKNFVDFDEDLQLKDFYNAAQEGFDNIELLKRFTTVGMGPSQGKHSNMNALRILARITGKSIEQVGTTTARPFFHPVPLSHLAGRGFTPERRTPLHDRHTALGAKWMRSGLWQRPEYYTQAGISREECIRQEAQAVRNQVGLIDVGTLGKLEVRGKDAAEFLERVYTGRYANLKVGMSRYALMLDESGVIIDDGVIARLDAEHFYFTTTTSGAANVYRELSRLNTMWQLDCGIVNLTGARSSLNLAGSRSRSVLTKLTDLDLSAFPYLGVREAIVAGIPALLMRVGFVGEWGYEIHVAAQSAPALWDALMEAGASEGIRPFGVEAQRLLRLEKGHLIVGQDTDGLTTPREAGLGWAVKMDKPFFIGQRSLQIVDRKPLKQKLVGFTIERTETPPQECNLVIEADEIAGRVTSIAFSPTRDRFIGLAYVTPELADRASFSIRRSRSAEGTVSDGSLVTATVTPTPFYDPENLRQKETAVREEVKV